MRIEDGDVRISDRRGYSGNSSADDRAYRGAAGSGWSTDTPYIEGERTTETHLRDDLARKPSAWLLTWRDSQLPSVVGSVWLEPIGDSICYLGPLAFEPEKQKCGRGRTMLQSAEDWAREHGAERMRLSVINVREALIAWYVWRGYERTGDVQPFPYGDDRFGKPLRNDLHFVILEKSL